MPVLPAPLSHQPPSPHPLLCLKRGYGIARGHPELGTHVAPGQAELPRGVPCPMAQPVSGHTGLRVPVQRARWALWETPTGSPLEAAIQAVGRSHWELPQREEQLARNRGVAGERGQAAQLCSDPPPPMQLLHSCVGTGLTGLLFAHPVPLESAPLSPPQTEHPAAGTVSHPDMSCPGIPAPHPPSVLARQPLHRAVAML